MVRENQNPPVEKSAERKPRVIEVNLSDHLRRKPDTFEPLPETGVIEVNLSDLRRKPDTFERVPETDIRGDMVPDKKG